MHAHYNLHDYTAAAALLLPLPMHKCHFEVLVVVKESMEKLRKAETKEALDEAGDNAQRETDQMQTEFNVFKKDHWSGWKRFADM